jgi:choline dehydrogenase
VKANAAVSRIIFDSNASMATATTTTATTVKVGDNGHVADKPRAVGVALQQKGGVISARKGVVLCAGAIHTPQLLQVSGVGDVALCESIGVKPIIHSPRVGQNLME